MAQSRSNTYAKELLELAASRGFIGEAAHVFIDGVQRFDRDERAMDREHSRLISENELEKVRLNSITTRERTEAQQTAQKQQYQMEKRKEMQSSNSSARR